MRIRSIRAATATCCTVLLGACASSPQRAGDAATPSRVLATLHFDNQGRERVDVYVLGETRSWRIGRLEPGQSRWLAIPDGVPASDLTRLQLAVLANAPLSLDPRRDPRAMTTLQQPLGALTTTRWGYAFNQITTTREGNTRR